MAYTGLSLSVLLFPMCGADGHDEGLRTDGRNEGVPGRAGVG